MTHPLTRRARRFLAAATALLVAAALASCTLQGPQPSPTPRVPDAPALPAEQFGSLPQRGHDLVTTPEALIADGPAMVAVVAVNGRVTRADFWHSADEGVTWQRGRLTDEAVAATGVDETVLGLGAVRVHDGGRRWLALGEHRGDHLAWSSADGVTWQRHVMTGVGGSTAALSALKASPGGFTLAGSEWNPQTGSTEPRLWTSVDGIAWSKMTLPGLGQAADVAQAGDTWVVVGDEELPAMNEDGRSANPRLLVSTDAGATWSDRQVPEPEDSGRFATGLASVAVDGTRLVAGGQYSDENDAYRGWVIDSVDGGVTWTLAPPLPGFGSRERVTQVHAAPGGLVAFIAARDGFNQHVGVLRRTEQGGWLAVQIPNLDGSDTLASGLVVGDTIFAGISTSGLDTTARLLRGPRGGETWTESTFAAPDGMRPRVAPSSLVEQAGVVSAWGSLQGAIGTWTRGDDGTYGVPRVVRDESRTGLGEVVGGEGGLLMTMAKDGDAQVAATADGAQWFTATAGTFEKVTPFSYSRVNGATWASGRWVVVGERSYNGNVRRSALVATSPDGNGWRDGVGQRVLQRGDAYSDTSEATDLDGLENLGRSMDAVAAVPGGVLAVGRTTEVNGDRPAVWRSKDAARWALQPLSHAGLTDAFAHDVAVRGERVVVLGHGRAEGSTEWTPVVWTSADGGATFTQGPLGDAGAGLGLHLVGSERGFHVVATPSGRDGLSVWDSEDGSAWHARPLEVPQLAAGVEVTVSDVLVSGDRLHLLARLATRADAVTVVVGAPLA